MNVKKSDKKNAVCRTRKDATKLAHYIDVSDEIR